MSCGVVTMTAPESGTCWERDSCVSPVPGGRSTTSTSSLPHSTPRSSFCRADITCRGGGGEGGLASPPLTEGCICAPGVEMLGAPEKHILRRGIPRGVKWRKAEQWVWKEKHLYYSPWFWQNRYHEKAYMYLKGLQNDANFSFIARREDRKKMTTLTIYSPWILARNRQNVTMQMTISKGAEWLKFQLHSTFQ